MKNKNKNNYKSGNRTDLETFSNVCQRAIPVAIIIGAKKGTLCIIYSKAIPTLLVSFY